MAIFLYGFTMFLLIVGIIVYRREQKAKIKSRLAVINGASEVTATDETSHPSFFERIIEPKWRQFKRSFRRNISNEKEEKLELKLLRAGSPFNFSPFEYRIFQLILFVSFPLIGLFFAILGSLGVGRGILLVMIGFILAGYLPHVYLKMKTAKRNTMAIKELPDFIDLLAVSMEAGLGFDSALSKVVSKQEGVLTTEFQRCLEELRFGKTRREALSSVRERLVNDDIKLFIGSVIQAEQLGVGMVQTLRVQADEIRMRRKQRAEEAAMKAPIKMLFPLVFFIFPCIFIVLLGPAIIQVVEMFMAQ